MFLGVNKGKKGFYNLSNWYKLVFFIVAILSNSKINCGRGGGGGGDKCCCYNEAPLCMLLGRCVLYQHDQQENTSCIWRVLSGLFSDQASTKWQDLPFFFRN